MTLVSTTHRMPAVKLVENRMREIRTSGLISGDGKRGIATAPVFDSTCMSGIRWRA